VSGDNEVQTQVQERFGEGWRVSIKKPEFLCWIQWKMMVDGIAIVIIQ
jgi:hypothetical protein